MRHKNSTKPKLLIFDFDGTLADTLGWLLDVSDVLAGRFNFLRFDRAEMESIRRLGTREILKRHKVAWWKTPLIAREARKMMARDLDRLQLFPGIAAALRGLKSYGHQLSVVSSNSEENIRRLLARENADLIDCYNSGASLLGKARKLRGVVRKLGAAPENTLCIGDELRDAEAAMQVGLPFACVTWGMATREVLEALKPEMLFDTPEELLEKLRV